MFQRHRFFVDWENLLKIETIFSELKKRHERFVTYKSQSHSSFVG